MKDRTSAADIKHYRQELDATLVAQGCATTDYELKVRRAEVGHPYLLAQSFTLIVTHLLSHRWTLYRAGPGQDWIAQLRRDLSAGVFQHAKHRALGAQPATSAPGVGVRRDENDTRSGKEWAPHKQRLAIDNNETSSTHKRLEKYI